MAYRPVPHRRLRTDPHTFRRVGPTSRQVLSALVEDTGGKLWSLGREDRLAAAFEDVLAEVKSRYVLVYDLIGPRKPGRHTLQVRLAKRKGEVRARRGYDAP